MPTTGDQPASQGGGGRKDCFWLPFAETYWISSANLRGVSECPSFAWIPRSYLIGI